MSICIFELARSIIGLNLVIFIGIFISQRANISYLGKLSDFYCFFFLFSRRYD